MSRGIDDVVSNGGKGHGSVIPPSGLSRRGHQCRTRYQTSLSLFLSTILAITTARVTIEKFWVRSRRELGENFHKF